MISFPTTTGSGKPITLSDGMVIAHIRSRRDQSTTAAVLSNATGVESKNCRTFLYLLVQAEILTVSKPVQVYIYEIADRITAPISEPVEA